MDENKQILNSENIISMQINDIRMAIQRGEDGIKELELLFILLPDEIILNAREAIDKIHTNCNQIEKDLAKAWTVQFGHPDNKQYKVALNKSRNTELYQLHVTTTQLILHEIINNLYKDGKYFTEVNKLKSNLRL